ncbi:hypothetical protein B0H10DRAFT_1950218 [Mycena sp. CBHHK59/15]|nr:hypothetical protein B0H10DRAFT_1950218 [Mycena sp. CBHHK59/15]
MADAFVPNASALEHHLPIDPMDGECDVLSTPCTAAEDFFVDQVVSDSDTAASIGSESIVMGHIFPPVTFVPISPRNSTDMADTDTLREQSPSMLCNHFLDPSCGTLGLSHPEDRAIGWVVPPPTPRRRALLCKSTRDGCIQKIRKRCAAHELFLSSSGDIDIVLDIIKEDRESLECGYYIVDHSARNVFWLDVFNMSDLTVWKTVPGIVSSSHVNLTFIELGLEIEYWRHCDLFPSSTSLSPTVIQELCDTIVYSIGDAMTSPTTTIPFPVDHMVKMLTLTNTMNMHLEAVKDETRSGFIVVAAPIYFTAFQPLKDSTISTESTPPVSTSYTSWNKLIGRLRAEWQDLILYFIGGQATLVLNANVGFLAIPNIGNSVTGAQISSYISIFFGLGSIIFGLILSRKYRLETQDAATACEAIKFFKRHRESVFGLEALAIVHSLPYVLMMWGMATFLLAFLIVVLEATSGATRGLVVGTFVTICVAVLGCILTERAYIWASKLWLLGAYMQCAVSCVGTIFRRRREKDDVAGEV